MGRGKTDAILEAVEGLGLFRSPRRIRCGDGGVGLEGDVIVEGRTVTLALELDPSFPLMLPRVVLRPWDALGFIPHVGPGGVVCYLDREGLLLDRRRPLALVEDALHRALRVLADGVAGRNVSEFADEFAVYWDYLTPQGPAVPAFLEPNGEAGWVVLAFDKDGLAWVASDRGAAGAHFNGREVTGAFTFRRGVFLPLEPGAVVEPPRWDRPFWDAESVRAMLLPWLSEENRRRLQKITRHRARDPEHVVVRLPRPSGGESLVAIRYDQPGERHPLHPRGTARATVPVPLQRLDRGYLVGRGGGVATLAGKRVLVTGCGAVGGHLAFALARAGVRDFTLLDPDLLTAENAFRHVLGRPHWNAPKVAAMKAVMESQLPYVSVTPLRSRVERALAASAVDLSRFDLVVLATGDPTVELMVNELLHGRCPAPPALFAWLEPLGIGGHALVANNARGGGCLECLYALDDTTGDLANRAAFAAPGQKFGRALTGCGSLHTPFGNADAEQTAVLAAKLAVEVLTGQELGNPLVSWKGDAHAFEGAGFRTSPRHGASDEDLRQQRYAYRCRACPVCDSGRDGASS